jgi:RNA polymerase sigma-70 factor (ECF subfamily)
LAEDVVTELLSRVARGDRAAFAALHRATAPKLAGVLSRMLRDRAEVDDALQEVFVKVWQRAAQFDPVRGAGLAWLVAVARHHALDRLRTRSEARGLRRAEPDPDGRDPLASLADEAPGPETAMLARAELGRLGDCLAELDPGKAALVRAAYLDGASYQELADRTGAPLNTIRTWLRRSLLRLRACLDR